MGDSNTVVPLEKHTTQSRTPLHTSDWFSLQVIESDWTPGLLCLAAGAVSPVRRRAFGLFLRLWFQLQLMPLVVRLLLLLCYLGEGLLLLLHGECCLEDQLLVAVEKTGALVTGSKTMD